MKNIILNRTMEVFNNNLQIQGLLKLSNDNYKIDLGNSTINQYNNIVYNCVTINFLNNNKNSFATLKIIDLEFNQNLNSVDFDLTKIRLIFKNDRNVNKSIPIFSTFIHTYN